MVNFQMSIQMLLSVTKWALHLGILQAHVPPQGWAGLFPSNEVEGGKSGERGKKLMQRRPQQLVCAWVKCPAGTNYADDSAIPGYKKLHVVIILRTERSTQATDHLRGRI